VTNNEEVKDVNTCSWCNTNVLLEDTVFVREDNGKIALCPYCYLLWRVSNLEERVIKLEKGTRYGETK